MGSVRVRDSVQHEAPVVLIIWYKPGAKSNSVGHNRKRSQTEKKTLNRCVHRIFKTNQLKSN